MHPRFLALTFITLLVGCSAAGEDEGGAASDLRAGSTVEAPEAPRLRGTCTIDGVRPRAFEVDDAASPITVYLGMIGSQYLGRAEISLGPAPENAVSLKTVRMQAWTGATSTSAEVTKASVRVGDEVSLLDPALWTGHTVSCTATLST